MFQSLFFLFFALILVFPLFFFFVYIITCSLSLGFLPFIILSMFGCQILVSMLMCSCFLGQAFRARMHTHAHTYSKYAYTYNQAARVGPMYPHAGPMYLHAYLCTKTLIQPFLLPFIYFICFCLDPLYAYESLPPCFSCCLFFTCQIRVSFLFFSFFDMP